MIHRPSLTSFTRDAFHFAGTLVACAVLGDYNAEARRLRADRATLLARIADLTAERDELAQVASQSTYRLAALLNHPSAAEPPTCATPITTGEFADAMAVLDTDDCGPDDLRWYWGEDR